GQKESEMPESRWGKVVNVARRKIGFMEASPDTYAPSAMNAGWPKLRMPELPMNTANPTAATTSVRNIVTTAELNSARPSAEAVINTPASTTVPTRVRPRTD